jgi:tartrate-resistant acid phosphatase type 5
MKRFIRLKRLLLAFAIITVYNCCNTTASLSGKKNKAAEPFTFFVLGDWGAKGKGNQLPVAKEMIEQSKLNKLSMILTVGDNFYEDGVSSINDEHWKLSYENVYKDLTKKYPWYVALGNHDYRGNIEAQFKYHTVNSNWNMPSHYYTFTKSTPGKQRIRFIIIDTDPYIPSYYSDPIYKKVISAQDTAKQTRWVDSVLAGSKEEWKIVAGHHPLYYTNAEKNDTSALVRAFEPLFKKYKVQAYIAGHVHDLQYNLPANSSTGYIISGSGSRLSSASPKAAYTLYSSSKPAFTICSIQNNELVFKFIDTTGNVLYQNTIRKK